jgi:hypothetical protein
MSGVPEGQPVGLTTIAYALQIQRAGIAKDTRHPGLAASRLIVLPSCWARSRTMREPNPSLASSGQPFPLSSMTSVNSLASLPCSITLTVPPRSSGKAYLKALVTSSFTISPTDCPVPRVTGCLREARGRDKGSGRAARADFRAHQTSHKGQNLRRHQRDDC